MAAVQVVAMDRSVKALGPDGIPRRGRFSQEDAKRFIELKIVAARWSRTGTRVICIQFLPQEGRPAKTERWLRTGTRYSYREQVLSGTAWSHKQLPSRAVAASLEFLQPPEIVDAHVRALYLAVPLSIMSQMQPQEEAKKVSAPVVSIEAGRKRLREKRAQRSIPQTGPVVEFRKAA